MEEIRADGRRRIDRVLSESYLDHLAEQPLAEVRALRDDADQEETDLSYLRRLLQGRLDIVAAELRRRDAGSVGPDETHDLVGELPRILADAGTRGPARGLGRHQRTEPSRAGEHRRRLEKLVADLDISDVAARTDDELRRAQDVLRAEEAAVSERRRAVQRVLDACSAEITRRYRDGEADVSALLETPPA